MSRAPQPRWLIIFVTIVALYTGGAAFADWEVGDPALYYQLPDTTTSGWDVYSEWRNGVANDWTAETDVPITDIHFWGSWRSNIVGDIGTLYIQIFDNDTGGSFAKPGTQLWEGVFTNEDANPNNNYTISPAYTTETQGFYDPRYIDHWYTNNHNNMYQYNIPVIESAFIQQAGETYWLMISSNYEGCDWGWKTSENVVGNTSVFWDTYGHHGGYWQQLKELGWCYPRTPEPLDVAFVLTPEPATLLLLAAGAAVALRRRRK